MALSDIKHRIRGWVHRYTPSWVAIYRVPTTANCLYLTFDDGIHPVNTPVILDSLKAHGAKATFFIIGKTVTDHPELLERIIEEGHAVGSHTHTHRNLSKTSWGETEREMDESHQALSAGTGYAVTALRPPWGRFSLKTLFIARKKGIRFLLWSVDSGDWRVNTPEALLSRLKGARLTPGDILLFHDDYDHTVQALPEILAYLSNEGWQLHALPESNMILKSQREFTVQVY